LYSGHRNQLASTTSVNTMWKSTLSTL